MSVPILSRSSLVGVAASFCVALAACGGSGPPTAEVESSSDAPTASVATTQPVESSTPSTSPSTSVTPDDDVVDPADLPGLLVMQAVGCGSPFSLDSAGENPLDFENFEEARDELLSSFVSTMEICVMRPDGSGLIRVSEPEIDAESPAWTLDGETVMYRSNFQWFVVDADGANRRPWDDPTYLPWRVSPDETMYVSTFVHDDQVYVTPVGEVRESEQSRPFLSRADDYFSTSAFRWSPDSRHVLYHAGSSDCPALWKVDVVTLERMPLTGPGSPNADVPLCVLDDAASWSPDGSTILVVDYEGFSADSRPYLMDADGANLRPLVADGFFADPEWLLTDAAWSPDGRFIMIDVLSTPEMIEGGTSLHVVRIADGLVTPIPIEFVSAIIDLAWMPEAPAVAPLVDEDLDAV